jgi:hypothetical protein
MTQTEEGFFGRAFRGITGAPSQQELAETDPSRLTTDIREASVNLNKIYNPLDFDDSAWNKAYKSFADAEGIELGMTPTGQYSLENLLKAKTEVQDKLRIINTLRQYQAYTEDDIGGITGHVKDIYEKVKDSGDQFTTVVTQIAKDMNETSVSDVMSKLGEYVPNARPVPQQGVTGDSPTTTSAEEFTPQNLTKILKEQVSGDELPVSKTKEGYPVFKVVIDGVDYLIANVPGSPYIVQ